MKLFNPVLLAVSLALAANGAPAATPSVGHDHIVQRGGLKYLTPGYNTEDVAKFFWESLNGWSETPDNLARYFTPNATFELAYAPADDFPIFSRSSTGHDTITRYFTSMSEYLGMLEYSPVATWTKLKTSDPGTYVFEYTSRGIIKTTGREYNQKFISIVKVRNGQIGYVREYWDPYVALRDFNLIQRTPAASD
ncbi:MULTISPECIES: nuclear transport factor 2 family protein [unclassified Lysobacter]|uniref:nuclear transport factor 2 family protein n=1 Tax=unclassified Lysobacter TaxID=2635362 RepID=UPI001BEB9E45|nr:MULTISPECIES: nuclear transport factor 2 family protein [unclassified Lysobacter]MBT2750065.1 nuclear transport factor 2 family protein [Lysobacter sp. ISL-50]MBT2775363.1 nuclear transport factor 2 family protein [Lysobacter sp. ISL-54]MBT2783486.1 nuclear transport factor 2 family protein [Lysobacter sp. ISL-52]